MRKGRLIASARYHRWRVAPHHVTYCDRSSASRLHTNAAHTLYKPPHIHAGDCLSLLIVLYFLLSSHYFSTHSCPLPSLIVACLLMTYKSQQRTRPRRRPNIHTISRNIHTSICQHHIYAGAISRPQFHNTCIHADKPRWKYTTSSRGPESAPQRCESKQGTTRQERSTMEKVSFWRVPNALSNYTRLSSPKPQIKNYPGSSLP